ncbi:MAG TPA: YlbF family regulator [Verrucomicrobiales bacterium]|jgi:cell fate (sporulation/competence/biofilm development) regulator YlbF (YheA/YmcA/DUF963 family)|nr:YlbF family regulator [Verrucomicrobiales bacterium]HIL23895.1 YlbF family regulator [Verrucomicrobiota bacterium]
METETQTPETAEAAEPQTCLDLKPIAKGTNQLCEAIVSQEGFAELYKKIDAFINDEKLKYEYGMLNDRGALLQQKQQAGVEIAEAEMADFEKLREEFMANPVATQFLEAQEEVQQVQDRIHQVIAKTFEVGHVPQSEDFDFCSDGFGNCGCE